MACPSRDTILVGCWLVEVVELDHRCLCQPGVVSTTPLLEGLTCCTCGVRVMMSCTLIDWCNDILIY